MDRGPWWVTVHGVARSRTRLSDCVRPTANTFVGKVMSLLFNMLSRLVTAFRRRSKRLLMSWLQSPSAVILKCKKIKSVTVSIGSHLP